MLDVVPESADGVWAWAASSWPSYDWSSALVARGAFHDVVVCPPMVVAQIASGSASQTRVQREILSARQVAELDLPFSVPRPVGGPVRRAGRAGFLTTYVTGAGRDAVPWDEARGPFAGVLDAFAAVPAQRCAGLPPVRAWCGGDRWPDVVADDLLQHLPESSRGWAERVVIDVQALDHRAEPGFVHGDLGLHNMLWTGSRITGVIDLDHACWADPAIDVPPLIGTFGAAAVGQIAEPDVVGRAVYHRASLPLQVAAAAALGDDLGLRDHALSNFAARLAHRSLYDPDGTRPANHRRR
jgi:aminoglycoside phosphotransferase (APT) family kinase protein